jgi:hypothetical protein
MSHLTMRILIKCTSYSVFLHFISYSLIIMFAIYTLLTNLFYSLPVFPFTASDLRLCILLQHSRTRNLISDYSQYYMSHVSAYVFGNFVTKRDKKCNYQLYRVPALQSVCQHKLQNKNLSVNRYLTSCHE